MRTLLPLLATACTIRVEYSASDPKTDEPVDADTAALADGEHDSEPTFDTAPPADTGSVDTAATDTGEPVETGLLVDDEAIARLADRVAATQNDDGSWDWQRAYDEALSPETTGYQNVTGVTALGFDPALARLGPHDTWQSAHDDAVAYFAAKLPALAGDPENDEYSLSSPTWTLLGRELAARPDPALLADATAALDALVASRDERFGTDDNQRIDGWIQYNVDRRGGSGIVPWDLALLTEALGEFSVVAPEFADEYAESCTILEAYVTETFLPTWTADRSLAWGDISVSMPLYVLAACPGADPDLLATLDAELELLVHDDGSVGNGSDDDGPHQATAYGLMALKRRESPLAQLVQTHGEQQVGSDGILVDGGDGLETFEIEGELLRALAE